MTNRRRYIQFRQAVLEQQDAAYDKYGESPDHIVLSEEMFEFLNGLHKFERLQNGDNGFIGMQIWKSSSLDSYNKAALLLSTEAFRDIATLGKDLSE